jgi:hypothetical protein
MKMIKANKKFLFIFSLLIPLLGCEFKNPLETNENERDSTVASFINKWYNGHTAAISITNDDGNPVQNTQKEVQNFLIANGLRLDYEIVTEWYFQNSILHNYMVNNLVPNDFGYFGHGHRHINHDELSYEESYTDFKQCYEKIIELGLKPVAYAYPGGWGYHLRTRTALADAGFLCGRKFEQLDHKNPFIVTDTLSEPKDWFALPTLVMQSYRYDACYICINNTSELIPYLNECLEKTAWLILTYHSIGFDEGYGFYEMEDFKTDMLAIKARDFWIASMNQTVLYLKEKKDAELTVKWRKNKFDDVEKIIINLEDGLPDDYYDQPLTISFEIPGNWINRELNLSENENMVTEISFNSLKAKLSVIPTESVYELILED